MELCSKRMTQLARGAGSVHHVFHLHGENFIYQQEYIATKNTHGGDMFIVIVTGY